MGVERIPRESRWKAWDAHARQKVEAEAGRVQ